MRVLVLFLVLLNVGFYAWARYMQPVEMGIDSRPLKREISPERLRIVSPAPREAPAKRATQAAPMASAAPGATPPTPVQRPQPIACLEWGSFTVADAPAAAKVVGSLGLGGQMQERRTEETANWWVYIAPQSDGRAGALRKTRVPKIWLQMREIDPAKKDQLETVVSRIPGTELRACEAGG